VKNVLPDKDVKKYTRQCKQRNGFMLLPNLCVLKGEYTEAHRQIKCTLWKSNMCEDVMWGWGKFPEKYNQVAQEVE
jgi:hypothetical protein